MSTIGRQSSGESQTHDIEQLLRAAAQASANVDSECDSGLDEEAHENGEQTEKRKKRSRACQACRNMKIRCNPVEGQEACLACAKVNRQCVMPGPARKRQKTVHKVAELEKKIEALTQSLTAKVQAQVQASLTPPQESPPITVTSRGSTSHVPRHPSNPSPAVAGAPGLPPDTFTNAVNNAPPRAGEDTSNYVDVVDRGLVDISTASKVFDRFRYDMNPMFPMVGFHPQTTVEEVRKRRPMVFLAILTSACGPFASSVHAELADEFSQQISRRVFYLFERSIDLLQAMILSTCWVGKHPYAKDLGFNQYIHSAVVMAFDLGLGKRTKRVPSTNFAQEAEFRRTFLSCYYSGACVSTTLRQPSLVRTTPYVLECVEYLEICPDRLETDATLCAFVRMMMLNEDVSMCFHMDDPASTVRLDDSSVKYQLALFERRLEEWKNKSALAMLPQISEYIYSVAQVYIHEIALHDDHNIDDFRPPGAPGSPSERPAPMLSASTGLTQPTPTRDFITSSHLEAITACVVHMRKALDTFITVFPNTFQAMPCIFVVWTAYVLVAMMRLYGTLKTSGSRYADVFLPDLRVDYYLDALIQACQNAMNTYKYVPIVGFEHAFWKLKVWHIHRTTGKSMPEMSDPRTGMQLPFPIVQRSKDEDERVTKLPQGTGTNGLANSAASGIQGGMTGITSATMNAQRPGNPIASGIPLDASTFENTDWNFMLEDWDGFEQSMVQPGVGSWLGYLI